MSLTKTEKIQFFYDLSGSFVCALLLGVICAMLANSSSDRQMHTFTNWEKFYFSLPFIFYLVFTHLFWKSHFFSRFRLNLLWLFISFFSSITTLLFSFFVRDIVNQRFLTDKSKFIPFDIFFLIITLLTLLLIIIASVFWYLGLIHRTVMKDPNNLTVLNLEN